MICIIGAGSIGLSIGCKLASKGFSVFVLEKAHSVAKFNSTHNSGVIHAGLYHQSNSLKHTLLNPLLKDFAIKYNVPFESTGKWITSSNLKLLKEIHNRYPERTEFIENDGIEPLISSPYILNSPNTCIIDTQELACTLCGLLEAHGGSIQTNTCVESVSYSNSKYKISTSRGYIEADLVINSAGLNSIEVYNTLSRNHNFEYKFYKGRYLSLYSSKKLVSRPIYPVPDADLMSLGIHLTPIVGSNDLIFGPDSFLTNDKSFSMEMSENHCENFYSSIVQYYPTIDKSKLMEAYCGVRPKLYVGGERHGDFYIKDEFKRGFPGFINLHGIESPGLSCCLGIADHVYNLSRRYLSI